MVTIDRQASFRIVIYKDDHPPPHVHVFGDGEVKIELLETDEVPRLLRNRGMTRRDADKAVRVVMSNRAAYLAVWREFHG